MTTPVGSIRLNLTVDGSGIWGDITREVMTRLSPALNELSRRLTEVERKADSAARAAKKSGAEQTAAAKTAEAAVEGLGNEYTQTAAKANASARMSTRAINATTRAIERQALAVRAATAEWTKYAAAQTAAAAAPTPSGVPGRGSGGGGGGGGSSGFGRGGGGGGRRGGALGFLTSPLGLNTLALGASALPPATLAVTNLVGAIQQLGQVGLVIPGVIGGMVASVGTAALGFSGMGDAVKALNEAAASGDPKDLEKVTEALKDMDPAAVAVARSVSKFTQGPLKELRQGLQGKMFAGVDQAFDNLVERRMPNLISGTGKIGEAWNGTLKQITSTLGSDSTGGILDRIFGSTAEGQKRANAAIDPLVKGIGTLTAAGTETLPRLGDALTKVSTRFSDFITKADGDGRLDKWIDQGLTGVTNLGNTFLNLGKSIASITKAAGGDGGLLKLMEQGSKKLAEFLGSAEGQEKLTNFFDSARQKLDQWLPILGNIANVVGDVFQGFQQWGNTILPVVGGITSTLADMPGLVQGAVAAFLAFKTFSGLSSLIGSITTLGGLLDGIPGKASRANGSLSGPAAAGGRGGRAAGMFGAALAGTLFGVGVDTQSPNAGPGALAALGGSMATGAQFGGAPGAVLAGAMTALTLSVDNMRAAFEREAQVKNDLANAGKDAAPGVAPRREILPGAAVQPPDLKDVGAVGRGYTLTPRTATPVGPSTGVTGFDKLPGLNLNPQVPAGIQGTLQEIAGAAQNASGKVGSLDEALGSLTSPPPLKIDADTSPADAAIKGFVGRAIGMNITIPVTASVSGLPSTSSGPRPQLSGGWFGKADGGVLPGYSPGIDNLLVPMSGGEGVVIPEAMRALGPGWLYNLNSRFRAGLSRRGYADGGVLPGGAGGLSGDSTVVNLLSQIRDLLAGKASAQSPLNATADGITSLADGVAGIGTSTAGATASRTGGKRNLMWDTAASFIAMFGGDPYAILGPDPSGSAAPGAAGGKNMSGLIGGLTGFARSGNFTPDLAALGLAPNSQIIKAITTARGKKKNALGEDGIASLIEQVLGTGTYSGALDSTNSSLINALLKLTGGVPATKTPTTPTTAGPDVTASLDGATLPSAPGLPGADIATTGAPIPVYIVSGPGAPAGGPGGAASPFANTAGADLAQSLATGGADALTQALGGALQQVLPTVLGKTTDALLGVGTGLPAGRTVQGPGDNPVSGLANLLGFKVTDFTRAGGGADAQNLMRNEGPQYDANGRLFADSSLLVDRTLTNMEAANEARHKQLMELTSQMRDLLTEKFLKPTMQAATTAGINGISSSVTAAMGSSMGASAAGPIAAAVKSAIPVTTGRADGGVLPGYSPGVDNLLVPMSGGEGVLIPEAVRGLGGPGAIYAINSRFRGGLSRRGYGHGFAGGGIVPGGANATVGADFFGLSQVPIIGDIVNMLIQLLLAVIGVQITTRDTLTDMTQEIRGFRGDFHAFDATGRLAADSAGLTARTQTNREIAEQQRMRILKDVIIGALRFVIEDILIPLLKAAIQAAINFGTQAISGAVGAAVSGVSFGAGGGLASGLANAAVGALGSIAQAGADILLNILSSVLTNGAGILVEALGNGITGLFPTILGSIAGLFSGIGGALTNVMQFVLSPVLAIGRLVGLFDEGGVGNGLGFMAKGTIEPERVLSPAQTRSFDRLVDLLDSGQINLNGGNSRSVAIDVGGITVDSKEAAQTISTHLQEWALA